MSTAEVSNKRINYQFKLIYALGIFIVVANHCGMGGISLFYELFPAYAFHMGLFVFASGYFYKEYFENNLGKYILKKLRTLILPLYMWNFAYALFTQLMSVGGFAIGARVSFDSLFIKPITTGHQFIYNLASWFVFPLFMVEIFNVLFRKLLIIFKGNKKEYIYIMSSFVFGMIGIYLSSKGLNTGWWLVLTRMLHFIPFYSAGYFYNKILEKHDKLSNSIYFLIVISLQLIIVLYNGGTVTYEQAWSVFPTFEPMPYIVAFLGIAFWLRVTRILEPAIGRSRVVNLLADNTFSIMVNQFLGFMLVKAIFAVGFRYSDTLFQNFNWGEYHTSIWYYYLPKGLEQFRIVYVFVAIVIPILIQKFIDKVKKFINEKAGGRVTQINCCICILIFILCGTSAYLVSQEIKNRGGVQIPVVNTYERGCTLYFDRKNSNASKYCVSGFSLSEENFTWTDGSEAVMSFSFVDTSSDLQLVFTSGIYGMSQNVDIYINDYFIDSLTITERGEYSIDIDKDYLSSGETILKFALPNAMSPTELGKGSDIRKLALSIETMVIQ